MTTTKATPAQVARRIVAVVLASLVALAASPAAAEIKAPRIDQRTVQSRTRNILRARHQRFSPNERARLTTRLKGMSLTDPKFQHEISQAPLSVRLEVFKHHATNTAVGTRRFHGMLKSNGKNRVSKAQKTFFEVTGDSFQTFQKVMGKNVVWFAVNASPGHLHTLIRDQSGDDKKMYHNTYGTSRDSASINSSYSQYALPVHLTDHEMDRFVRYLNAGIEHKNSKTSVFGFKARGNVITDIRCTNWATSAPIGDLPRWANTLEKRLSGVSGVPELARDGGLHGALAKAANNEARADIVNRVLGHQGLTKWTRAAVKRMHKAFRSELKQWPNRPTDLVLRKSLAETLGLSRSQDPAKWAYDLAMSKKVPVFAVTNVNKTSASKFKATVFDMEIMGKVNESGKVVANGDGRDKGVIPADRQAQSDASRSQARRGTNNTGAGAGVGGWLRRVGDRLRGRN